MRARYDMARIESAILAAAKLVRHSCADRFVYAAAWGFVIAKNAPFCVDHYSVRFRRGGLDIAVEFCRYDPKTATWEIEPRAIPTR